MRKYRTNNWAKDEARLLEMVRQEHAAGRRIDCFALAKELPDRTPAAIHAYIYRLRTVGDGRISPDGAELVWKVTYANPPALNPYFARALRAVSVFAWKKIN